jgi:hypothetical protein
VLCERHGEQHYTIAASTVDQIRKKHIGKHIGICKTLPLIKHVIMSFDLIDCCPEP